MPNNSCKSQIFKKPRKEASTKNRKESKDRCCWFLFFVRHSEETTWHRPNSCACHALQVEIEFVPSVERRKRSPKIYMDQKLQLKMHLTFSLTWLCQLKSRESFQELACGVPGTSTWTRPFCLLHSPVCQPVSGSANHTGEICVDSCPPPLRSPVCSPPYKCRVLDGKWGRTTVQTVLSLRMFRRTLSFWREPNTDCMFSCQ